MVISREGVPLTIGGPGLPPIVVVVSCVDYDLGPSSADSRCAMNPTDSRAYSLPKARVDGVDSHKSCLCELYLAA